MILLIVTMTIILYIVLIAFTINNLNAMQSNIAKIGFIITGLVIMLIITSIIFYISIQGVEYEDTNMINNVRNMLLAVFVPINGFITMPYFANILNRINLNNITQEEFKKKAIILGIIFLIIIIFECSYLKNTQLEILKIFNGMKS